MAAMDSHKVECCPRQRLGEFNMLKCCRAKDHKGDCNFVIDHDNDYPWNENGKTRSKTID